MERRRSRLTAGCLLAAMLSSAAAQAVPGDLAALLSAQDIKTRVGGWCRGEFRTRQSPAFVVALASGTNGGRYVVVEPGAPPAELAAFARQPSLACYTRAEAQKLDRSIRESVTIHGAITPKWDTTVICGFTDDTTAVCWQFSPADRAFVIIGQWMT